MLSTLTILFACQFFGELLVRAFDWPIPGPVIGLIVLLIALIVRGGPSETFRTTASGMLRYLLLLFVPAGAGIVTQLDVLGANFFPAAIAIVVSTAAGMAVTAWIMQRLGGGSET